MARKITISAIMAVALLAAAWGVLYVRNATPVVPTIGTEMAAEVDKPWVVKLHAQWCPVCMLTKGVWAKIEETYEDRVRFVVFDFTNEATTNASRVEAERLGLSSVFDEAGYATGPIIVLDGRTKEIRAWINGSLDVATYRAAVDEALESAGG